jgi:hypothetical protein
MKYFQISKKKIKDQIYSLKKNSINISTDLNDIPIV